MQIIRGLHNIKPVHRSAVLTIGNFDGVHLGHRAILKAVCETAKQLNKPSMVMIFEPQPKEFFQPERSPARLTPFREKVLRLASTGIDYVLCVSFNEMLRALNAQAFVEQILLGKLMITALIIGDDFRFGQDRQGSFEFLTRYAEKGCFDLMPTDSILCTNAQRVSSTLVREKLANHAIAEATALLQMPYSWTGRVIHGKKLGAQLGFATANLSFGKFKPPVLGVYAVDVVLADTRRVPGVANVGVKPTLEGSSNVLEVHLFNWNDSLYGQRLKVEFKTFIRVEQKFASLEALKKQIDQDVMQAKAMLVDTD